MGKDNMKRRDIDNWLNNILGEVVDVDEKKYPGIRENWWLKKEEEVKGDKRKSSNLRYKINDILVVMAVITVVNTDIGKSVKGVKKDTYRRLNWILEDIVIDKGEDDVSEVNERLERKVDDILLTMSLLVTLNPVLSDELKKLKEDVYDRLSRIILLERR